MNLLLINVSTRRFGCAVRLPEGDIPAGAGAGVSKSAVSRRFVTLSAERMADWMATDLPALEGSGWYGANPADGAEEDAGAAMQGIDEDQRHAGCHGDHRPDRIDQSGRGERNADAVEAEGERHILHHLAVAACADHPGQRHQGRFRLHDHDISGLDRDVGAATHGDANIRLHQRRGVVDSVADHGQNSTDEVTWPQCRSCSTRKGRIVRSKAMSLVEVQHRPGHPQVHDEGTQA